MTLILSDKYGIDTSTTNSISTIDNDSLCFANSSSSSLIEQELDKIRTGCMTPQDSELLTGNAIRYHIVQIWSHLFVGISVTTIGLQELRNTLKLSVLPHWTPLNRTEPNEHELEPATTIEEYYKVCPVAPTVLNRKAIDSMIKLFGDVDDKIQKETERMMRRNDCWDEKFLK
ncbi:unnamed protein product [Caenorhabditis nigoni]